jgi:hypothetical protein
MSGQERVAVHLGYEDPEEKERHVRFYTRKFHREELDQIAEELGTGSRSEALRWLIQIGRRSIVQNDPRNQEGTTDSEATTIRDLVPEGEDNAVDIRGELLDIIDEQLLEIIEDDPEIKRDGWEVYK